MMFDRLSDADKLAYGSRMCSLPELIHLKEEYGWSPESSSSSVSMQGPFGGALGTGVIVFAADQTIAPGLLLGLKATLVTVGIFAAKIAIIVGVVGVIVYMLIPEKQKETH